MGVLGFALVLGVLFTSPAFGQQTSDVTITKGAGAGQSCVAAKNCFDPSTLNVGKGTTVTWKNEDSVSHTVTSGNPTDNQTGTIFDSSLIPPGKEFTFTFKDAGTYHYFCQVHPWMSGEVIVGGSSSQAVPEFGPVTPAILIIAIVAIIMLSARYGNSLKP